MRIGVPTEIKPFEGRVGLTPSAVGDLIKCGCKVSVQKGAGVKSGYSDSCYLRSGAELAEDAEALFGGAELIVKVKEPVENDLRHLKASHLLFCYLHLAANPALTQSLQHIGLTAVGFETVEEAGRLPLLAPMSQIAGRVAVQAGAQRLHCSRGGKGVLLGGVPGTPKGKVIVLGAGVAGTNAAIMAAGMGADVMVFDNKPEALRRAQALGGNITTRFGFKELIADALAEADLVIGAVLVPGALAPRIVTADMVKAMEAGSVIVDISIDQGGCVETMCPTNYVNPVFEVYGILHMGVTNLPGAVPRTASQALSGALLPYVKLLADAMLNDSPALSSGINVRGGKLVHPALLPGSSN